MSVSPNAQVGDVVSVGIKVDGKPLEDSIFVREIEIETAVNRLPFARISLADGSPREEKFAASASGTFQPGAKIEIELGYNAKLQPVFSGLIRSHTVRLDHDGDTVLELGCTDKAVVLNLTRSARLFTEMTDADCLSALLKDAGLDASVKIPGDAAEHSIQHDSSDWDYLLTRAEANGCVVTALNGKVAIGPPAFDPPVLILRMGESVALLEAEIDAAQQIPQVTAQSWSAGEQKPVEGKGNDPRFGLGGTPDGAALADSLRQPDVTLRSDAALSQQALDGWARAQLVKSRLSRLKGRIRFPGFAAIKVGDQVTLGGLGKTFDGNAWASAISHHVTAGKWETELRFGLDRRWFSDARRDVSAPPAAGLSPGVQGLQIAKVLQTHDDPQGQDRIKVTLPLLKGGEAGHWVRIATPFAGSDAGFRFLPEIGDEVVLGFLQGDPNAAIMLGALHSAKRKPPEPADEKNTIKAITTTAGLAIRFDEETKTMTLQTPGGHSVSLDDKATAITMTDSTGNSVTMDDKGISLDAKGDLTLSASGAVKISGQTLTGEAKTDLSLKGTNLTAEAQAKLTAKGSAGAELSASGPVTVRGTPISLN